MFCCVKYFNNFLANIYLKCCSHSLVSCCLPTLKLCTPFCSLLHILLDLNRLTIWCCFHSLVSAFHRILMLHSVASCYLAHSCLYFWTRYNYIYINCGQLLNSCESLQKGQAHLHKEMSTFCFCFVASPVTMLM
jgi:hypothetical protein